ncbi:ShlB/FhaC/HecB family hemolysin secretion/activation protein [Candidatus Symbiobacter mobilis]|uniref:Hemolysin activation/secretion protein n=1 Tax=Candidatus Symbiobacter mobilis CR TaxID=946483 RepID=U5N520_9BURK|nr:ShlB/FhaC/HecB family hemolysin secretion/activation protein [Candidatus Symbiobacter mobilis]AGX86340.1 hemolysin activation/secretion protein [Candidatus Symbiobacter mobilis CR]
MNRSSLCTLALFLGALPWAAQAQNISAQPVAPSPVAPPTAAVSAPQGAAAPEEPALAQPTGATAKFRILGYDVEGDNPIPVAESERIMAPFVSEQATLLTLQQATATFEAAMKERGYPLHRVALPPQDLGGRVKLVIVKFVIGKVTVEGNQQYSEANIRASVPELQSGAVPNFTKLSVQTAISNENPGKQMQVSLKESEEADKIDVKLLVKESRSWGLAAGLTNTGTEATGKDRYTLIGNHANLFGIDHQFSGAFTTSLERGKDVQQLGLNYRIPFYAYGGVLGLSYTESDVVGSFGTFHSTGAGRTAGLNYSYYAAPVGGWKSYWTVGLDQKTFAPTKINKIVLPGQVERVSKPLTVGYTAKVESDAMVWGFNVDMAFNTSQGDAGSLAAYQAEDPRVQKTRWKALRAGANLMSALSKGWLWSAKGQLQYSPTALISGEQFGIGGTTSVRGTDERPVSGDSGASFGVELTSPEWWEGVRTIGFFDTGWVHNRAEEVNPSKLRNDQLTSVGLGLRYVNGPYAVNLDWGVLVKGSSQPETAGSTVPRSGDQKIHWNLQARF